MLKSLLALFVVANLSLTASAEKPSYPTSTKHSTQKIVQRTDGTYVTSGPRTLARKPKPRPVTHSSSFRLPAFCQVLSYGASAYKELPRRIAVSNGSYVDVSQLILREARNNNIDPLILELIIKNESNFNPYAVSGVGAQGLMQLMPETASDLGISDPFNAEQNVAAGARYFAQQVNSFGDLRLALAAYNAGPGYVQAYGGVPPFDETIGYVNRIAGEYETRKARLN